MVEKMEWNKEKQSIAKKTLAKAKLLETVNESKRKWIKKTPNCWIFVKKEFTEEQAIKEHDKKMKIVIR